MTLTSKAWPYPELEAWAKTEITAVNQLAKSSECVLPKNPDEQGIEKLCERMMEKFYADPR